MQNTPIRYRLHPVRTLLCLFLLMGCAPGLGTEVEVSALPTLASSGIENNLRGMQLGVKKFSDERKIKESISIDGRHVAPAGDLGSLVQGGLVEAIKLAGGTACLFNCPILEGEILQWDLKTEPNFPTTKAHSRAKIAVRLVLPDGSIPFHREYSGTMDGEHPFYNEDRLLGAYGVSMNEAIVAAISDPNLATFLKR